MYGTAKTVNWTTEREARLAELWASGLSCSQVAAELGGFDHCMDAGRSAVIGKICRLKLPTPAGKRVSSANHRPRAETSRPCMSAPTAPRLRNGGMQLLELDQSNCRWPFGHPNSDQFYFCGAVGADYPNRPYCAFHQRKSVDRTSIRSPKAFEGSAIHAAN